MRDPQAIAVMTALIVIGAGLPARAEPRVAFTSIAPPGRDLQSTLQSLRRRARAEGHVVLAPGAVRDALERPLAEPDPPVSRRARKLLERARGRFSDLDYGDALEELETAVEIAAPAADPKLLAELHLLEARIHHARGEQEEVARALETVRNLEPDVTLDPRLFKPGLVRSMEEVRNDSRRRTIEVVSKPPGAEVWIDGVRRGRAPLSAEVARDGVHYVVVRERGFESRWAASTSSTEPREKVTLELREIAAEEQIRMLRQRIAASPGERLEDRAREIAELAGVELLVLVEGRRAIVFHRDRSRLGTWTSPTGALASLNAPPSSEPILPSPLRADLPATRTEEPWYRTGWGTAALIGGGALVVGAVALALSANSGGSTSYTVTGFCIEGENGCQ